MGIAAFLATSLVACGPAGVEDRIRAVESGLVRELSAPAWQRMTIEDRLVHHRVPGSSLALIDDFEISWVRGYGTMEAGRDRPVTPETLFQTASIGKPVVAAASLHLVEAGRLDLDEDVNAKLVSWRIPENDFTHRAPVTLRRLLSHSAGTTVSGFGGYERGSPIPSLVQILDGAPPAVSPPVRVDSAPGKKYRYSGGGYLIVQQLMKDVTGRPFADLIDQIAFGPLGMTNSIFDPLPKDRWNRAAPGHRSDGLAVDGQWHVYPEKGAGPLWSTPTDMARFGIELMLAYNGKSDRLLSAAMAREMLTPQAGGFGLGIGLGDDAGEPLARELLSSISREYGWVSGLILEIWVLALIAAVPALLGAWLGRMAERA